jgi:hypothetical protein
VYFGPHLLGILSQDQKSKKTEFKETFNNIINYKLINRRNKTGGIMLTRTKNKLSGKQAELF